MDLNVASFWSGPLVAVMEVHFRSVLRSLPSEGSRYYLYLDDSAISNIDEFLGNRYRWLSNHSQVVIRGWNPLDALRRLDLPTKVSATARLQNFGYRALNAVINPQSVARSSSLSKGFGWLPDFNHSQGFESSLKVSPLPVLLSKPHMSDLFRIDVAQEFAGSNFLYLDVDVAVLKHFSEWPLTSSFVYSWPLESFANSALLFISALDKHALNVLTSNAVIKGSFRPWCVFTHSMCDAAQVEILPSIFFDPPFSEGTPFFNRASRFFKNLGPEFSLTKALPHSYAFHWHNQWSASIEAGSPAFALIADSVAE